MNNHFVNDDNTSEGAGYQPTVVDERLSKALDSALLRLPVVPAAAQGERRVWLEAAIAAQIEMGTPPHAAIAASLESLRQRETATSKVGKQNAEPPRTGSARASTVASLALLAPIWLAMALARMPGTWGMWFVRFQPGFGSQLLLSRVMLVGVPLVAGLLVGASGLRRPVKGILNAIAIICVPAVVIPVALADSLILNSIPASVANQLSTPTAIMFGAVPGIMAVVYWVPLAALGAGIGRRIASRMRRQPLNQIG